MSLSFILSAGLFLSGLCSESGDFVSDSLHAVTITADKGLSVSKTDSLDLENSFTISEILQQNTGLYVGDNGGLSGLKTVSLRGMGSAHTSIYIDGIRVVNVQSGQSDLGMLGVDNLSAALVDYAQNSVRFNTARPSFDKSSVAGKADINIGSFGTYMPSLTMNFRLSDKVSLTANASGVLYKGDYNYGEGFTRKNNDIRQIRGGLDLFGTMNKGEYHIKTWYNAADRGTPGPVSWPSDDRQKDINTFIQGSLRKSFSPFYSLRISAKGGYDDIRYSSSWGDSHYGQTSLQVNSAHDFQIFGWWKMSLAADIHWDGLKSSHYNASRTTLISVVATSFKTRRLSANIAVEYNGAFDRAGKTRNTLSPSADIRISLSDCLCISAFGRRATRVPTFNELYYTGYGNPLLRPEDAVMMDIGLNFRKRPAEGLEITANADAFLNLLTDKITSAPTEEDPAIWMPYNIGKVRSAGTEVHAGATYESGRWKVSADVGYTFLSAVDRTPDSYTYDCQIPYISKHAVVVNAKAAWKGWAICPLWQLRAGRTDGTGRLADWNTLDLNMKKSIKFKDWGELAIKLSIKNITDHRYETVSGYPMPGRSIITGIEFKF